MVDYEMIRNFGGDKNIAVILAGSFGGVAVARELGKNSVPTIVLGRREYVTKSRYCLGIHEQHPENIISFLLNLPLHVNKKPVLFTDDESYLELLYNHWSSLAGHYLAPMSANNRQVTDKISLYKSARKIGINAPAIFDDVDSVTGYPVIAKPLNGIAHLNREVKKVYECNNKQQLSEAVSVIRRHGTQACIQQIVSGEVQDLFSITLYRNSSGKFIIGYVMRKLKQFPEYGTGVCHITCDEPRVVEYSKSLLNSVNFIGVAEIEYKYCSKTGDFYIIEVNGRFPLHMSMIHKIGNRFAYNIYLDLVSEPNPDPVNKLPDTGEIIWTHFLKDILTTKPRLSLFSFYFYHLRNSKIQGAFWDSSDIKPVLSYYKSGLQAVFRKF